MKKPLTSFICILTIGCAVALFSCKKHNDVPKTCRIVTAYDSIYGSSSTGRAVMGTSIFQFDYDYKGRIIHMSTPPSSTDTVSRVWTYGPDYAYVYPGIYNLSTDTIYMADSNRVTRVVTCEPNHFITTTLFTYDAAGELMTKTQKTNWSTDVSVTNYSWSDGDMISEKNSYGNITTHTYYTDRPASDGDPNVREDIQRWGVPLVRNKHLIKSSDFGGGDANYNYTFDNTGKIVTVSVASGAYFRKTRYDYDCSQ